ncbi:hypothetical protein CAPTEDRAFT_219708 [Capitella teleta]|uniref:Uncharacterized protein n=1 Tax=Capitella teleta TaxID=283909 RepID=R7U469_CAPTE|nr:hypothetical protein CAPTEDRAFT_219708 [Capitella teleta]|eukprot:ELU01150.1 hypothetical protein CAPTEDRAFT_219708 [Capitella teleta]
MARPDEPCGYGQSSGCHPEEGSAPRKRAVAMVIPPLELHLPAPTDVEDQEERRGKHSHRIAQQGKRRRKLQRVMMMMMKVCISEIPGFYYDREKRKYFRILPGHNVNSGVVTREKLAAKNQEEKRQKDLSNPKENHRNVKNILKIIDCALPSGSISYYRTWLLSGLKPRGFTQVFKDSADAYEKIEHFQSLLLNRTQDRVVALWPVAGLISQRIQMLEVGALKFTNEDHATSLDLLPTGSSVLHSFNKVTNMTWAPFDDGTQDYILYTTVCVMGNNSSFAFIRNLSSESVAGFRQVDFNLGKVSTWTCAWNSHLKRFSVGSEKCSLLLDVETRRLWELFTDRSDVLSQAFTTESPHILLNGTRSAAILAHDLRSASTHSIYSLKHPSSVCHIQFRSDENYVCAADFSGNVIINCVIQTWDLRQRKVMLKYTGLQNECSSLTFNFDETDDVLFAAGHDCYTKLWSLSCGRPLHSIPPPCPASRHTIPSLVYASQLKSHPGCPTLLLGMKNRIHLYSI